MWPFHKHTWIEVQKQQGTALIGLITVITFRCTACAKYKQETLNGYIY